MALAPRVSTLVLLLALVGTAAEPAPMTALDDAPFATTPAPAAGVIVATVSKFGNVRFGPSKQAKAVTTLKAGQTVEVIGRSKVAEWWIVRFPASAQVWMHSKVLSAIDGGKRWRVNEDKARARDDARVTAEIVAELDKGQIVEDRGNSVGDWRAVHLPDAIAYMHESVLDLPADLQQAMVAAAERGDQAKSAWASAQNTYQAFKTQLDQDQKKALDLDWKALAAQLDVVISAHPDAAVKVAAQRLKEPVGQVIAAVDQVRTGKGLPPAPEPVKPTEPAPTAPVTTTPAGPAPINPDQLRNLDTAAKAVAAATVEKRSYPHQGFVSQKDFPKVGVSDVIIDDDGNVVAFLKVKAGAAINLPEYYWRWVGVKGTASVVDKALHDLGREVPLVEVEDVKIIAH
jgi:uncharacterized protein YgiM (DUF1202 family)